jgi:hypothetical protein
MIKETKFFNNYSKAFYKLNYFFCKLVYEKFKIFNMTKPTGHHTFTAAPLKLVLIKVFVRSRLKIPHKVNSLMNLSIAETIK